MRATVFATLAVGTLVMQAPSARSQSNPAAAPATNEHERGGLLEATRERARTLAGEIGALKTEAESAQRELIDTAAHVQAGEAELTALEGRLSELSEQDKIVRGSLEHRYAEIAELLAAMQRMGRNPPPVLVTPRKDALQMVRSAMILSSRSDYLGKQAAKLADEVRQMARITAGIRDKSEAARAQNIRLASARVRLSALIEAKRQTLALRSSELQRVQAEVRRIMAEGGRFEDVLAKVDRAVMSRMAPERAVTQRPSPAPAAAGAAGPATSMKPASVPSNRGEQRMAAIELLPSEGAGNFANARLAPSTPLHLTTGQLRLPVAGKVIYKFGEKTSSGVASKGLYVETRSGARVTTPADAWIIYAGAFRALGPLLIMNAGGGYHIVVAGMSRIDVQPGQFVLAGEPIGTMAASPQGGTGRGHPQTTVLYVEFRKDSQPIDSEPWWLPNTLRAQG